MRFRPCIDIHNGKVKQIVGGTLRDFGDSARENFVSRQDAAFYAKLYKKDGLSGGHIILLNPGTSAYYEETKRQALSALHAWPGGLQIGGGIRDDNAGFWLENGASHVIVTSFVFRDGKLDYENLKRISKAAGREHLVLDLSCRRKNGSYYIVTDRWQKFTDVEFSRETLEALSAYCGEFLVHAVDAEGKAQGIEASVAEVLGNWNGIPAVYAGGIGSFEDIEKLRLLGKNRVDFTVGSALDLFGGPLGYKDVIACQKS
ncbi:MAG: phosphoribosylformimino-5-aminoimidazole carboxamide ribotide isomerase [Eubacteriales bacterium]|nr:phosphoribosylformimino-5-aminoimidazole carboxamide ribotide isomerase [Eubacteriales bacterium]